LGLTTGQQAGRTVEELAQRREDVEGVVDGASVATAAQLGDDLEVLARRHLREHLVALRDVAEAGPRPLGRGQLADVVAVEEYAAAAQRQQAHGGVEHRRLAHPVAAHEARQAAVGDVEGHPEQDLRPPVRDLDVIDLEPHGCSPWSEPAATGTAPDLSSRERPRYTSRTNGSDCTCSTVPSGGSGKSRP
jgi:hypothetical protein